MERFDRRDVRFIAACLLVLAGGCVITAALFRRAFPEASIEFRVNRAEARRMAEAFLRERGRSVADARFAGEFSVDDTAKVYLERTLGLETAGRLYGREGKIWRWQMRWFRSGVKEEERAAFTPLGDLAGFRLVLAEDAPGATLRLEEARLIASAFLAARGLPDSALTPIEAAPIARPKRRDWTFVDEKTGVRFGDATVRYATTVSGDRLTSYSEFVHVPESWTRDYERLRSKNQAAGAIATFGLFVTLLAMLGVLVTRIVRKDVPWRLVAAFGGVGFVLALLSALNELPLAFMGYDTASPLAAFVTNRVVVIVLEAIATGAGIAIVVAAAEPIYRERFPQHVSLSGAFSPRGIQTKGFFRAVLLGYALAAFFFAYQAVFYVVAARFGAWAPADVPYSDMLNTAFPWATVLFIGFLPAVTEEGISRAFSISFLDRLGTGRVIAVVLPAFIWGFGHSTYPNQPFYIRGIEVGCAGVLIGILMLRFGVVPLLVWHFTVDAIYTALILLRSGNAYYVVSGAIASGILLLPMALSLLLYARRGGFLPAAGLSNADRGFVPAPPRTPAEAELVPAVGPVPGGRRLWLGAAAVLLVASFSVPSSPDRPLAEDRTGRAAAEALAARFLRVNGVNPDEYHSVAYLGTGGPEDQEVRDEKPQDDGAIPQFSEAAARYVVEHGGPPALRRLAERQLPLSYWVVRFFQPEKKAEWKVLIDARRARVVAYVDPIEEGAPAGPPPSAERARDRARQAAERLGYPAADYAVVEVGTETRPKRVDTTVVLESSPPGIGDAHPRLTAVFHGPRLAYFLPTIRVPEAFLRAHRKQSVAEMILLAARIVAAGAFVGLGVLLFLRLVRQPGFRWGRLTRPIAWTGVLVALGLANAAPTVLRQYSTKMPLNLFRLGVAVSLAVALLGLLLVAGIGFVLFEGARPGWRGALRRGGRFGDAAVRAGIAAAGLLGLAHVFHAVASRTPALYEPDPALPGSLQLAAPAFDAIWTAARAGFAIAALAAVLALAFRSAFFRTTAGRLLLAAAVLVLLLPSSVHSAADFVGDYLPPLLTAGWLALCAFGLLRDHAAAWALFALFAFGGRVAAGLLAQPAPPDRAAGGMAIVLLVLAGVALLAGRRSAPTAIVAATAPPPTSDI